MRLTYFLVAVLYGAAWPTAVLNTVVALGRLSAGTSPESALPFALLSWSLIAYVHYRRGWLPFRAPHPPTPSPTRGEGEDAGRGSPNAGLSLL